MTVSGMELTAGTTVAADYHSQLAMEAARRMRRARSSRVKRKTGQKVCHHLRMMLASEPIPRGLSGHLEPQKLQEQLREQQREEQQKRQQYQLGF